MPTSDRLLVAVIGDDEAQHLERIMRSVQRTLLNLPVDSVHPLEGEKLPGNAMGAPEILGWLAVAFASVKVLRELVETLATWSASNKRVVKCVIDGDELVLEHVTREEERAAIEAWLERRHHDN